MARIEVPFDEVDKLIEKGVYLAEICGATPKNAKSGNGLTVVVDFVIIEKGEWQDRKLPFWLNTMNEKKKEDGSPDVEARRLANYYIREFMTAVKAPYEEKSFDTEELLRRKAMIQVEQGEYEGRANNRITKVMPVTDDILASLGMS